MAESPNSILQALVDIALKLCGADSAGVSILEDAGNEAIFRWHAVAGDFGSYLGATMPRDFSPCGVVLDRNAPQLMADPVRYFPYIADLSPHVAELLLIPFYQDNCPIGTVWVVANSDQKHFDAEDTRIVTNLSHFASAAVRTLAALERAEKANRLLEQQIAERQLANEAFLAGQRRLKTALSAGHMGTWELNLLSGELIASDTCKSNFGRRADETFSYEELAGSIYESDQPRWRKTVKDAIATASEFSIDYRCRWPDGSIRWVQVRGDCSTDQDGRVVSLAGVSIDIHDRKRVEEELVDARTQLESALSAGSIGTWVWNVEQDRVYADRHLASLYSVIGEDLNGVSSSDFLRAVHPEDAERVFQAINQALLTGDVYEVDYRLLQADGACRWVNARARVERDSTGKAVRMPGVVVDITDRKLAEQELAKLTDESDRRRRIYETALSNTPDMVYVFDLNGRFTYANKSLLSIWGRSWEDSIGKNCLELGYAPWHAARHDAEIAKVIETRQPIKGEAPFKGVGGLRIYEYIFVPVIGTDGKVEAIAGSTRDTTERKAMEDDLRRLADELAEANRRKDEFLATLAHELRNPLAPISNVLEMLKDSDVDQQNSFARDIMERQLAQMVRLIDDLLDVSRISRGKIELKRERVELTSVVLQAVETCRPFIDKSQHELAVFLSPERVYLDADPVRLAQVFGNLLNNACKYSDPQSRITVTIECHEGQAVISVKDTGLGIPKEQLSTIFDMFTQVDRTLERSQGGLGIGLTLVRRFVELHGGTVAAFSEGAGQGSTFVVRLPMLVDNSAAIAPLADARRGTSIGRKILVVDDNYDSANSLAMLLKLGGNQTHLAHDGGEALAAAEALRPEVILLDIGLPKMNGFEVCRTLREKPWGKEIIVVALTGWGQDDDRRKSREAGFNGHLVKPVDHSALKKLLDKLLPKPV